MQDQPSNTAGRSGVPPAEDLHVVVLAAGKGTRMKSATPKVLHEAAGLPLIGWVIRLARALEPKTITAVVGHGAEAVRAAVAPAGVAAVVQEPQLGTGHALLQAQPVLATAVGRVLLLSGDVPLLRPESVTRLLDAQRASGAAVVVATAEVPDPTGYGRIIRQDGALARIVEHRDATPAERDVREINSGVYVFALAPLFAALAQVKSANAQGEYYLPDLIDIYRREGRPVAAVKLDDADEIRGINTRAELAEVARLLRARINAGHMAEGVTLVDPATAYIGPDVRIGQDTIIHPGVILEGDTAIGTGCSIHGGVSISNSTLGDGVTVLAQSVVTEARVGNDANLGPFARIRPGTVIGERVHVGNFVEIKKATLGAGTKVGHLTYLGDATIGSGVNVGAGTITCNYDGRRKHQTVVADGAFVGSDSTLVAPVRVGEGAYVAAGSTVTEDVPAGALGIARSRQRNKAGWVAERASKVDPAGQ